MILLIKCRDECFVKGVGGVGVDTSEKQVMSIRAVEGRFNLRSVVEEETSSRPLVLVQTPQPDSPFGQNTPAKSGLKFDFSSIQKSQTPTARAASIPENKPVQIAQNLKNPFGHSFDSNRADVMRLTAVVDDLNTRLKKSNEKVAFAESQLQRVQLSLVAERASANDKLRSMSTQLGASHSMEAQLRSELANASKAAAAHNASIPKFEAAVAAAVAADEAVEKSKRELGGLKEQLKEQTAETQKAVQELERFKEINAESLSRIAELERQFLDAQESEKNAVQERDALSESLRSATEKMNAVTMDDAVGCCPKCDSVVPPSSAVGEVVVEKPVMESMEDDLPDPDTKSAPTIAATPTYPDPIKMHARYNRLRDAVLKVSSCISAIEQGQAENEHLDDLVSKRDELYRRAKELKLRYDTIFGAAEPTSVVELSPPSVDLSSVEAVVDDFSFFPEGDAPNPPCTYVVSFAREMSQSCPLGGAFDLGSYDSTPSIGTSLVAPITSNGQLKESEPTEGHDAQNEMVTAVVADLTEFLKDAKRRDDELQNLIFGGEAFVD